MYYLHFCVPDPFFLFFSLDHFPLDLATWLRNPLDIILIYYQSGSPFFRVIIT